MGTCPAARAHFRERSRLFADHLSCVLQIRPRLLGAWAPRAVTGLAQKQIQDKGWAHPVKVSGMESRWRAWCGQLFTQTVSSKMDGFSSGLGRLGL